MKNLNRHLIQIFKNATTKLPLGVQLNFHQVLASYRQQNQYFIYENELLFLLPTLTLLLGLKCFSALENFIHQNYATNANTDLVYMMIFVAVQIMTVIGILYTYKAAIFLRKEIIIALNDILPGAEERKHEILRLWASFLQDVGHERQCELLRDWDTLGARNFCHKHFNTKNSNFINYYLDRAFLKSFKTVDLDFIHYSLIIPKLPQLSIDAIRKVLIHPVAVPSLYKEWTEFLFQNYTPKQIERLFSNHQGKELMDELINLNPNPLPVYSSFSELFVHESPKELPEELADIDNLDLEGIKIKVLKNRSEYAHTSDLFCNCVRDCFDHEGNFILFFNKEVPWACVQVCGRKVIEIKGYNNEECTHKREIIKILKREGII